MAAEAGVPSAETVVNASDDARTVAVPTRLSRDMAPPEGSPDQEQIPWYGTACQNCGARRGLRSRRAGTPALVTGPPAGLEAADPR
ncbi:hypothetical protein GCM10023196_094350 [Actinoallomurus vinaceus]|uniref:Uncharacterized protein n=1 Tax=Actinoallomurus vinaceus TaxID=1080074 RepID=A0ABP8UV79_9ACTN